jgi:hypothetical protein
MIQLLTRVRTIGVSARSACLVAAGLVAGVNSLPAAPMSEDLGAALFEDRVEVPEYPAARALLEPMRRLAGGQEAAPAAEVDWLQVVKEHMRYAQQTLAREDATGRASARQRQAMNELDSMLVKLQQQCQKCLGQCNSPTSKPSNSPKPGKAGMKPGQSNVQAAAATKVDRSAVARLVNDRWGRLPERQRDELLQPLSEEFVPEYAAETEAYFRALAEPDAAEDEQP